MYWRENCIQHLPYWMPALNYYSILLTLLQEGTEHRSKRILPKNVLEGELYPTYSLLDAHAGNSDCRRGLSHISSSSGRFQGRIISAIVGTVLVSSVCRNQCIYYSNIKILISATKITKLCINVIKCTKKKNYNTDCYKKNK